MYDRLGLLPAGSLLRLGYDIRFDHKLVAVWPQNVGDTTRARYQSAGMT